MNKALTIDWLTVTFPYPKDNFFPHKLAPEDGRPKKQSSARPYTEAVRVGDATIHWHPEHPEFRVMVRLDGEALRNMRLRGVTDNVIFDWIEGNEGRVTRIDLALDLFDSGGHVLDIFHAWKCNQVATTARTVTIFSREGVTEDKGATVYIGSRSSEKYTRIYDKGKEQNTDLDWIRIEIELKGDRAVLAVNDIKKHGKENAIMTYVRDVIEWSDVEWFEQIWGDEYELFELERVGRPETNHERWIREVCLPAVHEAAKRGQMGVLDALRAIVIEVEENGTHGNG